MIRILHQVRTAVQVLSVTIQLEECVEKHQAFWTLAIHMILAIKHVIVQNFQLMKNFLKILPQFANLLVVTVRSLVTIGLITTPAQSHWLVCLLGKVVRLARVPAVFVTEDISFFKIIVYQINSNNYIIGTIEVEIL